MSHMATMLYAHVRSVFQLSQDLFFCFETREDKKYEHSGRIWHGCYLIGAVPSDRYRYWAKRSI